MLAWASFTGGTEHTNPHPPKRRAGNYALIFFKEKAAVRTDAAPTNTNSTPRTQTTQTPPGPQSSPSQVYPPNTPLSCNLRSNYPFFLFNHLSRRAGTLCNHNTTHLPSNSNTLHPSPRT